MLKKYIEHVLNEAVKKDTKVEKSGIKEKIMDLFKTKPTVKSKSEFWPDAKGIYSVSHIKNYIAGSNDKVDQVFHDLNKEDKKINSILVKIKEYNKSYPFYYHEDYVSKQDAEKLKNEMEKSQKDKVISKPKEEKKSEIPEKITKSKSKTKTQVRRK